MSLQSDQDNPVQVFISYSHKDERLRIKLEEHLSILKRTGDIDNWNDRKITGGKEWAKEIDDNLESSQIVLLLISPAFMASDYCYDIEMRRAIARHESGEARVIPIILKPVDWEGAPFSKLQALPKDAKPVALWKNADEAWADVAKGIKKVCREIRGALPHSDIRQKSVDGQMDGTTRAPAETSPNGQERKGTPYTASEGDAKPATSQTPALQYASIKVSQDNPFWIEGRANPSRGDYVYPTSIFDWQWRHEFDLKVEARPEDVDPSLDVTLMNLHRERVLVTGIGTEVLRIGHITFSGASLPKALTVPVTATYNIEMPNLMPRFVEEKLRLEMPLDLSLEVNATAWAQMQDDYVVEGGMPIKFGLRLKGFGRRVPRFTLLRLVTETSLGQVYSENILLRRWM